MWGDSQSKEATTRSHSNAPGVRLTSGRIRFPIAAFARERAFGALGKSPCSWKANSAEAAFTSGPLLRNTERRKKRRKRSPRRLRKLAKLNCADRRTKYPNT